MRANWLMKVEFTSVFKTITGMEEINIPITEPITLNDVVKYIAEHCNGFEKYASLNENDTLNAHMNFVRRGRILLAADLIQDNDNLKVFLPVTGG
jgi:hypothetical protein